MAIRQGDQHRFFKSNTSFELNAFIAQALVDLSMVQRMLKQMSHVKPDQPVYLEKYQAILATVNKFNAAINLGADETIENKNKMSPGGY